ncbi:UNVERIFIED_CONTAM: hypothetical protein K2H54_050866 [Gekko kuhli]
MVAVAAAATCQTGAGLELLACLEKIMDFHTRINKLEEVIDAGKRRTALLSEKFNKGISEHRNSGPDACNDVKTQEMSKTSKTEWPEVSLSYREKKGPKETIKLNAEKWPHISMSNIRERRCPDLSKEDLLMREREGFTICQMRKTTQNMHECFPEYPKELKTEVPHWSRGHRWKGWNVAHLKKLMEKYTEASKKGVNKWPKVSTYYQEKKGPEETSKLNAEKWPHISMSNIRERQRPDLSKENLLMGEHEGSTICQMSKTTQNMHESFPEYPTEIQIEVPQWPRVAQKGWNMEYIKKLTEMYAKASNKDLSEWLKVSTSYREKKGPKKTSKLNAEKWLHMCMSDIRERQRPDLSKQNLLMGEREESTICQMSKTAQDMHERFPEYIKKIKTEVPQWPRGYRQKEFTLEPIKKLAKIYEDLNQDVIEWPEVSKLNAEKWPHMSMSNIRERRRPDLSKENLLMGEREGSTICQMNKTTQNMHERFPEYPKVIKTEVPQWPRDNQQKGYTLAPLKKLPQIYAEASKKDVSESIHILTREERMGKDIQVK